LPTDLVLLLRIVADDYDAIEASAIYIHESHERLREAAAFYIEQIMLAPQADSYRVLGTPRDAPMTELRRNLAYLCKWLHSDLCQETGRSVFLLRVTEAWNNVKTSERRNAYDAILAARKTSLRVSRSDGNHPQAMRPNSGHKKLPPSSDSSEVRKEHRATTFSRTRVLWRQVIALMLGGRSLD